MLLDDFANDAELVDVIRHEAGHILGTLDHGGAGLARYAVFRIEHDYSRAYYDDVKWRQYLKTKTTTTYTYNSGAQDDGSYTVGTYEDSTETIYIYDDYEKIYDQPNYTWYWPSPPDTEYIENNYTYNVYPSLSGANAKYLISNAGGTVTDCTAQTITVKGKAYRDETSIHGFYNGESSYYSVEYSAPRFYQGTAVRCKSTSLTVTGNAYATDCEAAYIKVAGAVHAWNGYLGDEYSPNGEYEVFNAVIENCTVNGGTGRYYSTYDYETGTLSGLYNSEMRVDFGGTASHVTVKSSTLYIGDGDVLEYSNAAKRYALIGSNAVVNDLVVDGGVVNVYYGGELHNANIRGTLRLGEGGQLSGTINTTSVALSNVVPTTTITIKLDLRDFAIANYVEEERDEQDKLIRKIEYFANHTARITEYSYFYYNDDLYRVDDVTVTYETYDAKDPHFNPDWKYTFEADLGSVDALSLPYIVVVPLSQKYEFPL